MAKKFRPILCVAVALFTLLASNADTMSEPRRMFGLGDLRAVAASADLRFIATGGQGGAFLWNAETGALLHRLKVDWWATALAFSPASNVLAVAMLNKVIIFDTASGQNIREFLGHEGEIVHLEFSVDGEELISASADNTARIWSMETGSEIHQVRTPGSPLLHASLSRDGLKLATVDTFLTNCVKIWDVATERELQVIPKTNWNAQTCYFTADGTLLTTAADRSVILWNADTAEQIRTFNGVTGAITMVMDLWMPNENTLAAAGNDGNVYLWNYETAALIKVVTGPRVSVAAGVPNDFLIVDVQADFKVRIRQLPGGDTLRTLVGHTTSTHSGVAFSPDGRYVLSGGTELATRLWDRKTGHLLREFPNTGSGTMAAAFSPDGSRILTTIGLPNPGVQLWNTEAGELEREFKWTGSWPMGAAFSPDGTKIAAHEQVGKVRIYDVASGALLRTLSSGAFGGKTAFSPITNILASTSQQFGVTLFNYETGAELHTFSLDAGPVTVVEFSPDGQTLMIGWSEGGLHLYNAQTFELRREFPVAPAFLQAALFSPDGRHLLTGEGWPLFTATLWDLETAFNLRTFQGHKWEVTAIDFSSNGASILTGAELVREWPIADLVSDLQINRKSRPAQVTWNLGQLQQAGNPQGPWATLTNAVSPFPVSGNEPMSFFRLHFEEP